MSTAEPLSLQTGNLLLQTLPRDVLSRLQPDLEIVTLDFKKMLYKPGETIPYVYFPVSAVASVITVMENGDKVEVGTVGREGFVGLPVVFDSGEAPSSAESFAQVPGEALRMDAGVFLERLQRVPSLHALILRYAGTFFVQVAQSTACNRLHTIDERCARWLLMTHDRVGSDHVPLTQEFLSQMLGVRRASVNAVAGLLQKSGLIRYSRGTITILDRKGLEAASCECYQVIRKEYERLLGA
jgi:CRP-like cAMP-binding protein